MKGKIIGYVRVSTPEQNPERQLENIEIDKKFIDTASGNSINRPALKQLMDYVREDDTVIVHSMDRLARNFDDLRKIINTLTSQKIKIKFLKENLTFDGNDSPAANLLLSIFGAVAEFERSLIKERQMEGIAIAKKKGVYKGKKPILTKEQIASLQSKANIGIPKSTIAKELGISRKTLYCYLNAEINNL